MAAVEPASAFNHPKIVEKAFTLPIVSDTYAYGVTTASSLTSPLQPYLPSLASLSPLVQTQLSHLLTLGEERLPGLVTSRVRVARDQVTSGVQYLDSSLCSGLDQLVVKVPSLASPSQALYLSTREAAVCELTLATTYLASFTLAQLALKVSDSSLETADVLLKQVVPSSYASQCEPFVAGIKKVRSHVEDVRREGATANGTQKVANMESSSLFSAVCEVFGLNYILDIFGVSKVVAEAEVSEANEDVSGKSGATAGVEEIGDFIKNEDWVVKQKIVADMVVEQEAIVDGMETNEVIARADVSEVKKDVATAEVGKIRAFIETADGARQEVYDAGEQEVIDDRMEAKEVIVDLPVQKEGKKSKKVYKN